MRKVQVDLGKNSYDIIVESGVLAKAGEYIHCAGGKIFVVSDTNVAPLYANTLIKSLTNVGYECELYLVKAGEPSKNINSILPMYEAMLSFGLTRKDLVVALGGGVVGDLTGFVASTYLRGVDFVQIPTSLLGQVDSSVGGKVAVDLVQGKNLVGSFFQPKVVLIDTDVLATLPDSFYIDGMAEVIKYGCILDKDLFEKLEKIKDRATFMAQAEDIIATCCQLKASIVERDELDKGDRMLLNFGHTYGHAVEKYFNFEQVSHGVAVGIGMSKITHLSEIAGMTAQGCATRLDKILAQYGLATDIDADQNKIIEYMANDKKNLGKELVIVLISEIGKSFLYPTTSEFFRQCK